MESDKERFPLEEHLHTDILSKRYGQIFVDVLRHDEVIKSPMGEGRIRIARLTDAMDILRTYAITFLTFDKNDVEIRKIDDKIRTGGLIGESFRANGYLIKKNVIDVFLIDLPEYLRNDFCSIDKRAKARLTEFYAKKGTQTPLIYGTVLEIYSPDFRSASDGVHEVDEIQINPYTSCLQECGVSINQIWENIDNSIIKSSRSEYHEEYQNAKKMSQIVLKSLHKKINKLLFGIDYI